MFTVDVKQQYNNNNNSDGLPLILLYFIHKHSLTLLQSESATGLKGLLIMRNYSQIEKGEHRLNTVICHFLRRRPDQFIHVHVYPYTDTFTSDIVLNLPVYISECVCALIGLCKLELNITLSEQFIR